MTHKYKVGDKVRWVKFVGFGGVEESLDNIRPLFRTLIENRTTLIIKELIERNKYTVTYRPMQKYNFYEEELEYAKITNWRKRFK